MPNLPLSAFPPDFVWGAATASFQIEGAATEDGRGESVWDRFCATPGKVRNGDNGAVACDFYHRYRDDIVLMRELGIDAFRLSVAWPRIIPGGRGPVNEKGLDFYDRLIDELLGNGITPYVTLFHWDTPQPIEDEGGWPARSTVDAFEAYVEAVAGRLGDRVGHWITHNEPWVVSWVGHGWGHHAPGRTSEADALATSHHLLLSHGLATQALRAAVGPAANVGIALNLAPVHAAGPGEDHDAAARRMDGHLNRWFLDPLLRGRYPSDMLDVYERRGDGAIGSEFRNGDLPVIAEPIDFLGVNYYFPQRVFAAPQDGPLGLHHAPAPPPTTTMGWEVDPGGLHDLLVRLRRDYGPLPVYITENGASFDDPPETEGLIEDPQRTAYLRGHLEALAHAVADGVDVRRYCVWSLLDNFEWEHGYDKRFGIVHVDYRTQRRSLKRSALWYRDHIAAVRGGA